jgi:hypothetical protein
MGAEVRIYKPSKTAMQSGRSNTKGWILEFEPYDGLKLDPLMGWSGSQDTSRQLKMRFPTKDDAIAYAKRRGLTYRSQEPKERILQLKTYADNFAYKPAS